MPSNVVVDVDARCFSADSSPGAEHAACISNEARATWEDYVSLSMESYGEILLIRINYKRM